MADTTRCSSWKGPLIFQLGLLPVMFRCRDMSYLNRVLAQLPLPPAGLIHREEIKGFDNDRLVSSIPIMACVGLVDGVLITGRSFLFAEG